MTVTTIVESYKRYTDVLGKEWNGNRNRQGREV